MVNQQQLAGPYLVALIVSWLVPYSLAALLAPFGIGVGLREYAAYWFGPGIALFVLGLLVATVNFGLFLGRRVPGWAGAISGYIRLVIPNV